MSAVETGAPVQRKPSVGFRDDIQGLRALAVLLLPVVSITFIRAMVGRQSNLANGFTLVLYTLIDGLLAYLLLGSRLTTWIGALVYLGLVAVGFGYNLWIMSMAVKLDS